MDRFYPANIWCHVFTDGSAEDAVRNGGGGVYIKFPDGTRTSQTVPTGKFSSNFRAEACALLEAAQTLNNMNSLAARTVVLSDCKSMLQSLQSCRDQSQLTVKIRKELSVLCTKTDLILQWIPAHCGIQGNDKADLLSKEGSKKEQPEHSVSYSEAKTLLKNCFYNSWMERLGITTQRDSLDLLTRKEQVTIFRLRTGHCRLLAHLNRLNISDTEKCPSGTSLHTHVHILQEYPLLGNLCQATWPEGQDFKEKLWGPAENLRRTADYIAA